MKNKYEIALNVFREFGNENGWIDVGRSSFGNWLALRQKEIAANDKTVEREKEIMSCNTCSDSEECEWTGVEKDYLGCYRPNAYALGKPATEQGN